MGFDAMLRSLIAGALLLALAGCGKEAAQAPEAEVDVTPQIASLEDYGMPADKSDQITAIDAATGDAGGMPRDGGATIALTKAEPRRDAAPGEDAPANAAAPAAPLIVPPAVPGPPAGASVSMPIEN